MSSKPYRIVEAAERGGDFTTLDDGYVYFWPTSSCGAFSANDLRILADELDRRNKEWDDTVQKEIGP
jgi:hypothetical protein